MTDVITYSLRDGRRRSDQFYEDVTLFNDEVLVEAEGRAGGLVEAFQTYIQESGCEEVRTTAEYAFELLTLGVLWRVYAADAIGLAGATGRLLDRLVQYRERYRWLKPGLDGVRGVLAALFLAPRRSHSHQVPPASLENFDQLLNWLVATGDFKEEVKRLRPWRDFLNEQTMMEAADTLEHTLDFAGWFEVRSQEVLGRYTPHVDQFLNDTHPGYRWREDAIFCGRRRVEYHMNMIGTVIMNRAFRQKFLATGKRVVLLPPCMKAKPGEECEAHETPFGERCAACTPGCRVHQVTKLGEKHGFDVFILPHELNVFSGGKVKPAENGTIGIVGVSCPLTNVTGGWETRDIGLPAQGLFLDYCGCSWHWHLQGGIPTDINFNQLLKVMDVNV